MQGLGYIRCRVQGDDVVVLVGNIDRGYIGCRVQGLGYIGCRVQGDDVVVLAGNID